MIFRTKPLNKLFVFELIVFFKDEMNEKENSVDLNLSKEDKTIELDDWSTKIYEDESLLTDDEESDNDEELSEPNIISPELMAYMVALGAWHVNRR